MADITVNSHDILGKLTIIKNYLAVVAMALSNNTPVDPTHIDCAMKANEDLIQVIKDTVK